MISDVSSILLSRVKIRYSCTLTPSYYWRYPYVRRVRIDNEQAADAAEKEFHRSGWWAYKWLKRFDESGLDGLKDLPRSGRPPEVSEETFAEIRRELSENPSGWKVKEIMNMISSSMDYM